jgi:hypothetical protein
MAWAGSTVRIHGSPLSISRAEMNCVVAAFTSSYYCIREEFAKLAWVSHNRMSVD